MNLTPLFEVLGQCPASNINDIDNTLIARFEQYKIEQYIPSEGRNLSTAQTLLIVGFCPEAVGLIMSPNDQVTLMGIVDRASALWKEKHKKSASSIIISNNIWGR